jgi:hypothetical protein
LNTSLVLLRHVRLTDAGAQQVQSLRVFNVPCTLCFSAGIETERLIGNHSLLVHPRSASLLVHTRSTSERTNPQVKRRSGA